MKHLRLILIMFAVILLSLGIYSTGHAFHSGGVAECEGCHTMHNSFEGAPMFTGYPQFQAGPYLLRGTDQSDACLNCHEGDTLRSYRVSTPESAMPEGTPPVQRTPGGDFGWLKKTYSWVPRSGADTEYSHGERHGHNIVATDHGYVADSTLSVAPGGSYPANKLACSSCHDPHGKYRRNADGSITTSGLPIRASGSYNNSPDPDANFSVGVYRLLAGADYEPKSTPGYAFTNDPPAAVAPSSYNRSEDTTQTRVAYGMGMSEWCANCHTQLLQNNYTSGMAGLTHPAGNNAKLGLEIANNYNAYVKTGDMTGTAESSYNSLVPFEEGVTDHSVASYTTLKAHALSNDGYLQGPDATNSNVMCLSCHRAHASGWDSMVRYNLGYEFMVGADSDNNPGYYGTDAPYPLNNAAGAQGRTQAEHAASYYDRPATKFAAYQRALCNKCHAKD